MLIFGAGPGRMPEAIKQEVGGCIVRENASLLELSDRSEDGKAVLADISSIATRLLSLPDDFTLLIVPGGGTLQFTMTAYSLRGVLDCICFVETDYWVKRAKQEMACFLKTGSIFDGSENYYSVLPSLNKITVGRSSAVFITSNNTASGTQWSKLPEVEGGGLCIVDMSSDLFGSLPDYNKVDLVLACAQKNFGVAGLSFVIIRNELFEKMSSVPNYLSYRSWHEVGRCYSTFPMVPAMITRSCLLYIEQIGLEALRANIEECSSLLYEYLDSSEIFEGSVVQGNRSRHNVTFDLRSKYSGFRELAGAFFRERGIVGLKGHPSVGGFRASFYFGASRSDSEALVECLNELERRILQ